MGEKLIMGSATAENYEFERQPEISWLDIELNGGKPGGNGYEGGISAAAIGLKPEQMEAYRQLIDRCFVPVAPGAPDRCGDGRGTILLPPDVDTISRQSQLDELRNEPLGPQLFGGTFGEALPYRVASGTRSKNQTAYDDFTDLIRSLRSAGVDFTPGSHSDEHATDSSIGCGKKDKHPKIMSKMVNFGVRPQLKEQASLMLVDSLMSEKSFEQIFERVVDEIDELNTPESKAKYLNLEGGERQFKHKVFEAVTEIDESAAPQVKGSHKEAFVVINYVHGQTFNNNLFVNQINNQTQAFNVDFWRVVERAEALFGDQPDAKDKYIVTAAVDTIATAMVLTAGDQRVGVRS